MITKKELRENNINLSRAEISERAIEIFKMGANGSYKNAVACMGRIIALSKAVSDEYWDEKIYLGASHEKHFLLSNLREDHPDKDMEVN